MSYINWSNVTEISQLPAQANTAGAGLFWSMMFYLMYILLILLISYAGMEASILIASFLMLVIGVFLLYADLIAFWTLLIPLGAILSTILYVYYSTRK